MSGSNRKPKKKVIAARPFVPSDIEAQEFRRIFLKFCRDRRGSGLRAWRLDLDRRGINRVPYLDFRDGASHMGLELHEVRLAWQAYGPPGGCPATALEFHEFDPAEWDNLNKFLELLWDEFNFDLDLIWRAVCKIDEESATIDAFQSGLEK